MPFELQAEEFERALGLAREGSFGQFTAPTIWVPGSCEVEFDAGLRETEMPINEWDETHLSREGATDDGAINVQVCPGQEAFFFHPTLGILARKDRRRLWSFSAMNVMGEENAELHSGLTVDTWNLSGARGEDLALNLDCKGRNMIMGQPTEPNYANLPAPYILEEMTLMLGGQHRVNFDSVEIAGEHNLRDDIYGSNLLRQDMTTQGRKLRISLEGFRESMALQEAYVAQTAVAMVLRYARGARSLTATAANCRVWEYDPENARETVELKALGGVGRVPGLVWAYS